MNKIVMTTMKFLWPAIHLKTTRIMYLKLLLLMHYAIAVHAHSQLTTLLYNLSLSLVVKEADALIPVTNS